jgi:hypothetical protein
MSRISYLTVAQTDLLNDWGKGLMAMFGRPSYQVGSSLKHKDWRDVDVRFICIEQAQYEALCGGLDLDRLNLTVSLWGARATGLPIDFQVQSMAEANAPEYEGLYRKPIGMSIRGWPEEKP